MHSSGTVKCWGCFGKWWHLGNTQDFKVAGDAFLCVCARAFHTFVLVKYLGTTRDFCARFLSRFVELVE